RRWSAPNGWRDRGVWPNRTPPRCQSPAGVRAACHWATGHGYGGRRSSFLAGITHFNFFVFFQLVDAGLNVVLADRPIDDVADHQGKNYKNDSFHVLTLLSGRPSAASTRSMAPSHHIRPFCPGPVLPSPL